MFLVHCFYVRLARIRQDSARSGLKGTIVTLSSSFRALRAPPRCARYVPFFNSALSTCPLGCFRAGGRQRVAGALSHVSSRAFATAPLSSYPSDESPLSSLPFGPKALVDVPFLSAGCDFLEISRVKKMAPERLFYVWKCKFGAKQRVADFGRLAAIPFRS